MRKAIGFLIILWGISQFLPLTLPAADDAAIASLNLVETAANTSSERLQSVDTQ